MTRLTFVLPDVKFTTRSGGYRVHYEMASRLAARGHRVTVVHLTRAWRVRLRAATWRLRGKRLADGFVPWFAFSPTTRIVVARKVGRRIAARRTDTLLLTSWTTVDDVAGLGSSSAVVLVWDYEFWYEGDDALRAAMQGAFARPGLRLVAGSVAVEAMLRSMGLAVTATIPPGIDLQMFRVVTPLDGRPSTVGYLHRVAARRGIPEALAALDRVRTAVPSAEVRVGGAPDDLLSIRATHVSTDTDDDLRAFYNGLAVFLLPSHVEGLGLPALEAMACGAAVVVTDNGGSRQFARDGENALVVPVGDESAMSEAITRLLTDAPFRRRLAAHGVETVKTFDWDRAVDDLERVLAEQPPA